MTIQEQIRKAFKAMSMLGLNGALCFDNTNERASAHAERLIKEVCVTDDECVSEALADAVRVMVAHHKANAQGPNESALWCLETMDDDDFADCYDNLVSVWERQMMDVVDNERARFVAVMAGQNLPYR